MDVCTLGPNLSIDFETKPKCGTRYLFVCDILELLSVTKKNVTGNQQGQSCGVVVLMLGKRCLNLPFPVPIPSFNSLLYSKKLNK